MSDIGEVRQGAYPVQPYLILHKVRGEAAFDIAEKVMIGEEQGWIIPTSGHRAYPSWWMPLNRITINPDDRADIIDLAQAVGIPPDWPDHYGAKAAPKVNLRDLLGKILTPIASNIKKRAI